MSQVPSALQRKPSIPLNEKLVWSIYETTQVTGLSDRHILKAIQSGELQSLRSGRRVLLDPAEVRKWLGMDSK